MLKFNRYYFLLWILLFAAEVMIALYAHDSFIRPFGGDFLVVILMYCFVKSMVNSDINKTALGVLLVAYLIEWSQWLHILNILGLQHSAAARVMMGTDFAWMDMLMYTLGILSVLMIERIRKCL